MTPHICGEFRLVADPELRFTPSGAAVCNVRLVAQDRKKDDQTGEWSDDPNNIAWVSGSVWRLKAENVAESLRQGDLVVVVGKLRTREYEVNGERRTATEINIDHIGASLATATAKVTKAQRQGGQQQQSSASAADPWATAPGGDEPPF